LIAGLVGLCMDCLNIEYRVILPDYRYRHTMEVRMPFAMEVRMQVRMRHLLRPQDLEYRIWI